MDIVNPGFTFNPYFHNGQYLCKIKCGDHRSCCRRTTVQFDEYEMPDELTVTGLYVPLAQYREAIKTFNTQWKEKRCGFFLLGLLFYILVLIVLGCLIHYIKVYIVIPETGAFPEEEANAIMKEWLLILGFVLIICTPIYFIHVWTFDYYNCRKESSLGLTDILRHHHILGVYNNRTLLFFYYNLEPCLSYTKEHLLADTNVNDNKSDLKESQNKTSEELLFSYLWSYIELMGKRRLPAVAMQRHTKHGACLCQFAQDELENKNSPVFINPIGPCY